MSVAPEAHVFDVVIKNDSGGVNLEAAGAGDGFHIGLTLFGLRHCVRDISTTKSKAVSLTIWLMKYQSIIYFHIVYSVPCYLVCYSSRACRQSSP